MSKSLKELQAEVNKWQRETFPHGTGRSILKHFIKEAKELVEDQSPEEAADVVILVMGWCDKMGLCLQEEIERKLAINRERIWGEPDGDGVVEHIKGV
jgi:hypothetical protein